MADRPCDTGQRTPDCADADVAFNFVLCSTCTAYTPRKQSPIRRILTARPRVVTGLLTYLMDNVEDGYPFITGRKAALLHRCHESNAVIF